VASFTDEAQVDLLLPCTMDFEIATTKYFYGLETGGIRTSVLFSGTIFYSNEDGMLQAAQIPWDREAGLQIAIGVWRQAIDAHYSDRSWLPLSKETFDQLYQLKVSRGVPSFDALVGQLLRQQSIDAMNKGESKELQAAATEMKR
jgi:hypothetical protein